MKVFIYLQILCLFISSLSLAKNYDLSDYKYQLVNERVSLILKTKESPIYKQIENAILEFYDSPYKSELCKATAATTSEINYATGVKTETAEIIYNKCEKNTVIKQSKIFPKKYIIVKDTQKKLPIDSWTNRSNHTFLVIDNETTYGKLKELVAHELAFTLDSKFKMTLNSHYGLSPDVKNLPETTLHNMRQLFLAAKNDYIAYLFGLMRAYQVEDQLLEKAPRLTIADHNQCVKSLIEYFNNHQNVFQHEYFSEVEHPLALTMASDDTVGQISFDKDSLADLRTDINIISDSNPYFTNSKNEKVSFCQYMTEPLITAGAYYNLKAIGPRPRTGGGWGGEDGGSSDTDSSHQKVINDF